MLKLLRLCRSKRSADRLRQSHSVWDDQTLVHARIKALASNSVRAQAHALGVPTMEDFNSIERPHIAVLRHHGVVYDLGGMRPHTTGVTSRWMGGGYTGAGVVPELLDELLHPCPAYTVLLNVTPPSSRPTNGWIMIFYRSVFNLYPGEHYPNTADAFRGFKLGGKLIFFSNWRNLPMTGCGTPIWIICAQASVQSISTLSCTAIGSAGLPATLVWPVHRRAKGFCRTALH